MWKQTMNRKVLLVLLSGVAWIGCAADSGSPHTEHTAGAHHRTSDAHVHIPSNSPARPASMPTSDLQAEACPYARPGFVTQLDPKDGRLWVFRAGSEDLATFLAEGAPVKQVIRPGAGPLGLTLKSTESDTIIEYVATKPGFHAQLDAKDGRLWVFKAGSEHLAAFLAEGPPVRQVIRPGAGPLGLTLKSTESDTIIEYVTAKPEFHTRLDAKDGRLWVFKAGSEDLAAFLAEGPPVRQVIRPGAGPLGLTLKSTESETIVEYVATKVGFSTIVDAKDGRLWVFKAGSEDLAAFLAEGPPVKQVIRPAAGPFGLTLKSTEGEIIDAYLATH